MTNRIGVEMCCLQPLVLLQEHQFYYKIMDEKKRLLEDATILVELQTHISKDKKENMIENVKYFLSIISRDSIVKDCFWEWYRDDDSDEGIDLVWNWVFVKGRFGIDIHNGHGFSFEFGTRGGEWCGGGDGVDGFYPDYDVEEIENILLCNHLVD